MLKEAVIHLVKNDNQGHSLAELNETYLKTIAKTFGGFTVTEARGGWVGASERPTDRPMIRASYMTNQS